MTENDLINLGFNKIEINNVDSQNGYDYYYYTFEIFENLILSSVDSDRVENNNWYVINFDWPKQFKLSTKTEVFNFIQFIKNSNNQA